MSTKLSVKLRGNSRSNAIMLAIGIMFLSAMTKCQLEKISDEYKKAITSGGVDLDDSDKTFNDKGDLLRPIRKLDKLGVYILTISGCSLTTAMIFLFMSKERDSSKTFRDGLKFGLFSGSIGALLTETRTVSEYSLLSLDKAKGLIASSGAAARDVILHAKEKWF